MLIIRQKIDTVSIARPKRNIGDNRCNVSLLAMNNAAMSLGTVRMGKGSVKSRFVIAVFDSSDGLRLALSDLLELGFAARQLAVVALAPSLDRMRTGDGFRPAITAEVAAILDNVETTALTIGQSVVVVSRNSLWQRIGSLEAANSDEFITANWMEPQLRVDLARHVRAGAVVLGVSAETSDQQRQGTRVLLKHSSSRVQTHEFSRAS